MALKSIVQVMTTEKRGPGKPRKEPRTKYTVDITITVLNDAKNKHPDLHRQVVGFIQKLSEDKTAR